MKIAVFILKYLLNLTSMIVPMLIILKIENILQRGWFFVFSPVIILAIFSILFVIVITIKNIKAHKGEKKNGGIKKI